MKAATCEVRSNRIRKIQNGGYTDIFQREAEQERKLSLIHISEPTRPY